MAVRTTDVVIPMSQLTPSERHQLSEMELRSLLFFRPAVLAQYRAEPHRYEVKASDFDGEVTLTNSYWEELHEQGKRDQGIRIRFGYRRLKSGEFGIAMMAHDFREYSEGHVQRWLPFRVDLADLEALPDPRFESWAARTLFGSWQVENNLIDRIAESIRLINAATFEALGGRLFTEDESPHVAAPASESDHAYQDAHRELYAYLLDGLDKRVIKDLLIRTGATAPKGENGTRKLLQAALPNISSSSLWTALAKVSDERGKAAHKVRPRAQSFGAFEAFAGDLDEIRLGMRELLEELERTLGVNANKAKRRYEAQAAIQRIDRPMQNIFGVADLDSIVGRTVAKIEKGLRENLDDAHRSDVVLIYFIDGSVLGLDTGTNACNVSSDHGDFPPSDFDVYFIAKFVPPPQ